METVTILLKDPKVYKILEGMVDIGLIRIVKDSLRLSSLRGTVKSPMSNEQIDKQLNELRDEWQRDM